MINFGVGVVVFHNGKILLTQREDFEVWCVPGGKVEEGESLTQAAWREVKEETGLEVNIERLVGIYSMLRGVGGSSHDILFAGQLVGGQLCPDPHEVIAAAWFGLHEIPEPMLPWMRQPVLDAFAGEGGSAVWRQEYAWPFAAEINRGGIYRLRDESGLTRQDFFQKHFPSSFSEIREA